jgi:cob(I)alamin adenosyltransferase
MERFVAKRLTKIYTRTGDRGMTRLASGDAVAKTSARVRACGDLDETNSAIGVLLSSDVPDAVRATLAAVQQDLFDLGAEIALPERPRATDAHVERLERELDAFNAELPPLTEFVLPGGPPGAAACHLARAICRRAERTVWELADEAAINPALLKYLNRLSDLLFVIARVIARAADPAEPMWQPDRAID